jgi:hypothetical protein
MVERMAQAADFVLKLVQLLAGFRNDDVLKAKLVVSKVFRDRLRFRNISVGEEKPCSDSERKRRGKGRLSGGRSQQSSLQRPWHFEAIEAVRRISVVLAAFINHPQIAMRFRLVVRNDPVKFSDFERSLVLPVVDANRKIFFLFGVFLHG